MPTICLVSVCAQKKSMCVSATTYIQAYVWVLENAQNLSRTHKHVGMQIFVKLFVSCDGSFMLATVPQCLAKCTERSLIRRVVITALNGAVNGWRRRCITTHAVDGLYFAFLVAIANADATTEVVLSYI